MSSYLDLLTDDIIENIINIRTNEIEISIHILEMQMLILEQKIDKIEIDSDGNNLFYRTYDDNVYFLRNFNPDELFKPFHIGKVQLYNEFSEFLSNTYVNPTLFNFIVLANDVKYEIAPLLWHLDDANDILSVDEPRIIKRKHMKSFIDILKDTGDITYYSLNYY